MTPLARLSASSVVRSTVWIRLALGRPQWAGKKKGSEEPFLRVCRGLLRSDEHQVRARAAGAVTCRTDAQAHHVVGTIEHSRGRA